MKSEKWEKLIHAINIRILPYSIVIICLIFMVGTFMRLPHKNVLHGVTLAAYPADFSGKAVWNGTFQSSFDDWIKDNFYKHAEVARFHNQIEYSIFQDGNGIYAQGSDGYCFVKGQIYHYAVGPHAVSDPALYDEYVKNVAKLQKLCLERGKDFLFLLSPFKEMVYPDKIPWYDKIIAGKYANEPGTAYDLLREALNKYGVHYYELTDDLITMRQSQSDYRVFCNTGEHWTLTAAAYETGNIFKYINESDKFGTYPAVKVDGLTDDRFGFDTDIVAMFNLYQYDGDVYNSPIIHYPVIDSRNVFMFGSSNGVEIFSSLYRSPENRAYNELTYMHYLSLRVTGNDEGSENVTYREGETIDDMDVMARIRESSLVLLEMPAYPYISEPHNSFVNYAVENFEKGYYTVAGNLIRELPENSGVEFENFYGVEPWGEWTKGQECSVSLTNDLAKFKDTGLILKFSALSFAKAQDLTVCFNGHEIGKADLGTEAGDFSFSIPAKYILPEKNTVSFMLGNETTSPKEQGISEDTRDIGMGFYSLELAGE